MFVFDWAQSYYLVVVVSFRGGVLYFLFLHKVKHNVNYVVWVCVWGRERERRARSVCVWPGWVHAGFVQRDSAFGACARRVALCLSSRAGCTLTWPVDTEDISEITMLQLVSLWTEWLWQRHDCVVWRCSSELFHSSRVWILTHFTWMVLVLVKVNYSIQFIFICIAPNHNKHYLKALYIEGQDLNMFYR